MKSRYSYFTLFKLLIGMIVVHRGRPPVAKIYFHGVEKGRFRIFKELLVWLFREQDLCKMYYAFGLNLKDTDVDEYIGPAEIERIRQKVEITLRKCYDLGDLDYRVVCKDKNIATSYLTSYGIKAIDTLALIIDGSFMSLKGGEFNITRLLEMKQFVLKRPNLEASGGFNYCRVIDDNRKRYVEVNDCRLDVGEFEKLLNSGLWILQEAIVAHSELVQIGGLALHTTRIVTVRTPESISMISSFQAFTTGESKSDSWANGSVYVGIDAKSGRLKKNGFYSPWSKNNAITTKHPDTGIEFYGVAIPFYKEAVNICEKAHRLFYANFSIGWDVAITDQGPVLVECNETPGMNAIQCVDRGLRSLFMTIQSDLKRPE